MLFVPVFSGPDDKPVTTPRSRFARVCSIFDRSADPPTKGIAMTRMKLAILGVALAASSAYAQQKKANYTRAAELASSAK